jgi:hypothetical protein
MIAEAAVGAIGGGLLRMAPEVLRFFDRQRDRDHELEMQRLVIENQKANPTFAKAGIVGDPAIGGAVDALATTIREQFKATGTKLDWISVLVRPATTYALVSIYSLCKVYALLHGANAYGADDYSLLGGILAFWFADRSLRRAM